ncbi:MAG: methyltransferase domain-containing protein [Heliobacteriaceae bacterium]|jgi:malonyl-ACP O-methyltransferase BioC|nr:methyltransferase domain-containing protein [Heliobacteriaceae bacterium]
MQVNPKIVKKQFEKSMDKYNENAVVQRLMAQKLVSALAKIRANSPVVLEIGAGTGVLTEELVKNITYQNYFANDLSEKSKKYLDKIFTPLVKGGQGGFTFIAGNAQKIKLPKSDLIIANAVFQWFSDLEKITDHCAKFLNPGGILAFTTFSPDNFKEIRELTGLALEYDTLDKINLEILHKEEFQHQLTFNNPLEILAHMKNTGVNSLTRWTFRDVKDFCERCKTNTLTYSPVIVIAKRCNA